MERLNYDGREIRDAFGWLLRETERLEEAHAGNWRRMFTYYTEGVRTHYEALRLLARMLDGHAVDAGAWFREAGKGNAPPPPDAGYPHVALVWKQLCAAVLKPGEGFFTASQVDFPYVLSSAFPGESLGERFHNWKIAFLDPYVTLMTRLCEQVIAQAPGDDDVVDLWDLAMPLLQALPGPNAARGEAGAPQAAVPEVAPATKSTSDKKTGRKKRSGGAKTKKAARGRK